MVAKPEAILLIIGSGLVQALRDDVGTMLYKFQAQYLGEGYVLKNTMKKRGG